MQGKFGLLSPGKPSSHSTTLPSFFSSCEQRFRVSIPPAVMPTILRQMDLGYLTCAQMWMRTVHTKGGQAQTNLRTRVDDSERQKNCSSPCRTWGSNPGSSGFFFFFVRSDRNSGSSDVLCCCTLEVLHRVVDLLPHRCVSRPSFCSQILVSLTVVFGFENRLSNHWATSPERRWNNVHD